jgi:hypothetical protein
LKNENEDFFNFCFLYGSSIQFLNIISKASSLCSTKALSQEHSKFVDHVFHGVKETLFPHFNRYNLVMYVINFFETLCTHYFYSPKQDPMVESQKKN